MKTKILWLACTVMLSTHVACTTEPVEPVEAQQTQQSLLPNGSWQLTYPNGTVTGDTLHLAETSSVDPSGNTISYVHLYMTNSQNTDISAQLIMEPLTSTDYQVHTLNIIDDQQQTFSVAINQNTAQVNWNGPNNLDGNVQGVDLSMVFGEGDETTYNTFELDFDLSTNPSEPIAQEPIPDPENIECPAWLFYDELGIQVYPNQAARTQPALFVGYSAQSELNPHIPDSMLIKLKSGEQGVDPMRGAELVTQGVPPEGFVGTWPAVMHHVTVRENNLKTWAASQGHAALHIDSWNNGLMHARVEDPYGHHVELRPPYGAYYERWVNMTVDFQAPHPKYNDDYVAHCLENGLTTMDDKERRERLDKCLEKARIDYNDCLDDAGDNEWKQLRCQKQYSKDQQRCRNLYG